MLFTLGGSPGNSADTSSAPVSGLSGGFIWHRLPVLPAYPVDVLDYLAGDGRDLNGFPAYIVYPSVTAGKICLKDSLIQLADLLTQNHQPRWEFVILLSPFLVLTPAFVKNVARGQQHSHFLRFVHFIQVNSLPGLISRDVLRLGGTGCLNSLKLCVAPHFPHLTRPCPKPLCQRYSRQMTHWQ
jgi:hypothetical protein